MSHTPGPWFRNQLRSHGADPSKNGCDISAEDGSNIAIVLHILRERTAAQSVANADLVAAAPELLAALEALIEGAEFSACQDANNPGLWDLCIKARAAIAKAKGAV
jgi:hypothetical protein